MLALASFLLIAASGLLPGPASERSQAAVAFLASLPEPQRESATVVFEDGERVRWNFVPGQYRGVSFADLGEESRSTLDALLDAHLSPTGLAEVSAIRGLEAVLFERESRPGRPANHRDPERYFLAVFGEPGGEEPWGWRMQGHHLSMNFTQVGSQPPSFTPFFRGANPLDSGDAPGALVAEVEAARALVASLGTAELERARIAERVPRDVSLGPGQDPTPDEVQGVLVADLDREARALFLTLMETFLDDFDADIVEPLRRRMGGDHVNGFRFAWVGSLEVGEEFGFHVYGDGFTIEASTPRGQPDHLHWVWRDATDEFGRGLIARHLEAHHEGDDR